MTRTVDPTTGAALIREATRHAVQAVTIEIDETADFTLVEQRALVDASAGLPGSALVHVLVDGTWRTPDAIRIEHRESESLDAPNDGVPCPVCDGNREYPGEDGKVVTCAACKGSGRSVVAW